MVNNLVQESSNKFCCKKCNYFTSRKSQYERHLLTDKHKKIINDNNLEQKVPNEFICDCGKKYNYLSVIKILNYMIFNNFSTPLEAF